MPDSVHKARYAFVDSANLYRGIRELGWKLDLKRFRIYLQEKYRVQKAFMFMGYMKNHEFMYDRLRESGFICIFKPTVLAHDGTLKGNVDGELILQAMIEFDQYYEAVLVTGDGDFHCLVKYLFEKRKLHAVLVPNQQRCSALLKLKAFRPFLRYMDDMAPILEYKKRPHKDETL